jgi:hypothetical protein
MRSCSGLLLMLAVLATSSGVRADEPSAPTDAYATGYADAILREVYLVRDYRIALSGSTLEVTLDDSEHLESDKLARALLAIEGVERVVVMDDGVIVADERRADDDSGGQRDAGWDVFPQRELFAPLLADPRWPHFSAAYQWYVDDDELTNVGATVFGGTFGLLRSPKRPYGAFELGFQAGVFSVFDLDSDSMDLVNSDFMVGLTVSHQIGELTSMLRFYHQSSHLGDEYLLRNRVNRVNLSYEVLDLLLSYDPTNWLRLYGGGGLLVHREPSLDRGLAECGVELLSPMAFLSGHLRPLAAADLQFRQESDWNLDLSTRFGVQIEHPTLRRLRVQILGEYYRGRSPNGQFYGRRIETLGVGVHLGF